MSAAEKCPCGSNSCKNWLVHPEAYIQGVSFSEEEAKAVANLLNAMRMGNLK